MKKLIIAMVLALAVSSAFVFGGCSNAQDGTSSTPTEPTKATQSVSSEMPTETSAAEPGDSSQEETQPQASSSADSSQDDPDSSAPQDNTPDLTGKWEPAAGESIASGQAVSLSEIYGSGLSYGGSLELNSDGTFFVGVGIINDNSSHKGTYTVSGGEIHAAYKNGTEDTFWYLPDYNGGEAMKVPQGDYYIYFCR